MALPTTTELTEHLNSPVSFPLQPPKVHNFIPPLEYIYHIPNRHPGTLSILVLLANSFSSSACPPPTESQPTQIPGVPHPTLCQYLTRVSFFIIISMSKIDFANVFYMCSYSSTCIYGDKPPHPTALKN